MRMAGCKKSVFLIIVLTLSCLNFSGILSVPSVSAIGDPTSHIRNGNFQTGDATNWTITGDSNVYDKGAGNYVLNMSGTSTATQVFLTNITIGEIQHFNATIWGEYDGGSEWQPEYNVTYGFSNGSILQSLWEQAEIVYWSPSDSYVEIDLFRPLAYEDESYSWILDAELSNFTLSFEGLTDYIVRFDNFELVTCTIGTGTTVQLHNGGFETPGANWTDYTGFTINGDEPFYGSYSAWAYSTPGYLTYNFSDPIIVSSLSRFGCWSFAMGYNGQPYYFLEFYYMMEDGTNSSETTGDDCGDDFFKWTGWLHHINASKTFLTGFKLTYQNSYEWGFFDNFTCIGTTYSDYRFNFIGIIDEELGNYTDPSERAVDVTAHYTDGNITETFTLNGTYFYDNDTQPQYFNFDLGSVRRQYWVSPSEGYLSTVTIYVCNQSLTEYELSFLDWTGALKEYSYVSAWRYINGTLLQVDKRKIDAEDKVVMGLIRGEQYIIQFEKEAGTLYTWGELITSSDTTISLVVKGLDFPQEVITLYQNVRAYGERSYYNSTHDTISLIYEDLKESTNSVNVTIYYQNDTIAYSYLYGSGNTSFTHSWNGASWNISYYSVVTTDHGDYGTLEFKNVYGRRYDTENPFDVSFAGSLPGGVDVGVLVPSIILLCVALIFSPLTSGIAGIVVFIFGSVMTAFNWLPLDVNILVFTGTISIIYAVIKNYRRFPIG